MVDWLPGFCDITTGAMVLVDMVLHVLPRGSHPRGAPSRRLGQEASRTWFLQQEDIATGTEHALCGVILPFVDGEMLRAGWGLLGGPQLVASLLWPTTTPQRRDPMLRWIATPPIAFP